MKAFYHRVRFSPSTQSKEDLIEETEKIRHDYLKKLVGTNEKVLFENEIEPNLFQGYTKSYLPVRMKYNRNIVGEELEVKIIDYTDEFCIAE